MVLIQFSVVITTYNRCKYVLEAIESIQNQSYTAYEIIVVSDGSTDDTLQRIAEKFPSVITIDQPNLGPSIARNSGIEKATGEWVCFLDDDDLWHSEKLEATARYMVKNPDAMAINHPVWYFSETESGLTHYVGFKRDLVARDLEECHRLVLDGDPSSNSYDFLLIQGNSFKLLMEVNRGIFSASVVRRDIAIRAGGFSPMQRSGDDWTFFVNVARITEWHTISRRLGFTRLHATQSTNDCDNMVYILAGQVNAWYTGCPMPKPSGNLDFLPELKRYGAIYRVNVQAYFWTALATGQWRMASIIWTLGKLLLPNRKDRIYASIPPPITWRFEHHVLGRHK